MIAAAIIGFPDAYLVREGVYASVTVDFQVRMGELGRPVVVRVFTDPDTAMGQFFFTHYVTVLSY